MNRSLLQLLTENVQHNIPEKYKNLDDLSLWNKTNRDAKLSEARELKDILFTEAEKYLTFISSTKINGKSLLQLKIEQEIEISIAQFLGMCREQMDATVDLNVLDREFPFDYDWVQKEIRSSLKTITNIEDECLIEENKRIEDIRSSEEI